MSNESDTAPVAPKTPFRLWVGGWPLFKRQLSNELLKLFARPRTYIGFSAFFIFELIILILLNLPGAKERFERLLETNGYAFDAYFTGPTLAVIIVSVSVFLLGGLYLALISGDIVAKEVEDGTMRMILNRPVPRWQVLFVKWISCLIYTYALAYFIGATSLLAGFIYRGMGGMFVFFPEQSIFALYPMGEGLWRMAVALTFLGTMLCTISSIGFFFSCLRVKPAAATILTLSLFFADMVMKNMPQFADYKQFFLTYHMSNWAYLYSYTIPWPKITESLFWLGAVNLTCFCVGTLAFSQRDFKS